MEPAGTHLPVLQHMIKATTGPVLEMGMGENSTPVLHDACKDRLLVSIDNDTAWVEKYASLRSKTHKIVAAPNWDDTSYLLDIFWDIVLIDHAPVERRVLDIQRLMHNAKFLVIHDTECPIYNYEPTLRLFRYRWSFQEETPHTTVVSMIDSIPEHVLRELRPKRTILKQRNPYPIPKSLLDRLVKTAPKPKLSVLIATLDSRTEVKSKLVAFLKEQCDRFPDSVEILESSDNGEMILGDKRNLLLDRAMGDYVAFVDDDDMVAPTYIEDILAAIEEQPDCVTFKGLITKDGANEEKFRFDMNYFHNIWNQDANGMHLRCPSIWCPVKASIAKTIKLLSVDCGEDRVWAIQLYPLLNTQVYINKNLYFYRSSTTESEAQKAEKIEKSRKVLSAFEYIPYVRK